MKKINILSIAVAAATLFSTSSVFAADHEQDNDKKLQEATKNFEDLAVKSKKLTDNDLVCWGQMKKSLEIK